MRQVVSNSRRPDPLSMKVAGNFEGYLEEAEKNLRDQGYNKNFAYQVNASLPPLETFEDVKNHLDEREAVYVLVMGTDGDNRETEMVTLDYDWEKGDFDIYGDKIDQLVENSGYSNQFWNVGSVGQYADKKQAYQVLDNGFPLQATARIEAGLEEPVTVGWFYRAPLDSTLEFGYQCFNRREGPTIETGNEDKLLEETLAKLTGQGEEKRNEHPISYEEQEVLRGLEDEMRDLNII